MSREEEITQIAGELVDSELECLRAITKERFPEACWDIAKHLVDNGIRSRKGFTVIGHEMNVEPINYEDIKQPR